MENFPIQVSKFFHKKFLIFCLKSFFLYFRKWIFQVLKKSSLYLRKPKFLIFPEMELSSPRIRNFLTVSSFSVQNFSLKIFLTFFPRKTHSKGISYIFSKKAFLIFWEKAISSLKLENRSYISAVFLQSLKNKNFLHLFSHFLFVERKLSKYKHKRKKFLILSLKRGKIL